MGLGHGVLKGSCSQGHGAYRLSGCGPTTPILAILFFPPFPIATEDVLGAPVFNAAAIHSCAFGCTIERSALTQQANRW